jgi:hypothetical protein
LTYTKVHLEITFSGPSDVNDKRRFPTTMMTLATSHHDVGKALIVLPDMLQWKKLSFMCDTMHIRSESIRAGVLAAFTERSVDFDISTTKFRSGSIDDPHLKALIKSCQHSRSEFKYSVYKLIKREVIMFYLQSL